MHRGSDASRGGGLSFGFVPPTPPHRTGWGVYRLAKLVRYPPPDTSFAALTLCHPAHRCAGGGIKHHASNMITLRTVLPAFIAAKPSLISESFSRAEIQSSRCSLPRM